MRENLTKLTILLVLVGALQMSGCASVFPLQTIPFNLESSGILDVAPGENATKKFIIPDFYAGGFNFAACSFAIGANAVSVVLDGAPGKGLVNQQTNTLTIDVWIDGPGNEATVGDTGERYGPFNVVLDDALNVVSISSPPISLSADTARFLNGGSFVMSISANANFSGQVRISQLDLIVQVG